ncbi:MAG TPA: tRNA uridine-5-carboxymethylaminomethyl(34) synthesis GTPase MnmE [Geminicoccaceae bacterium]|nr:tRNA uridine-5-carboxymethylaminomethyl(34) synthesis GTPase MnmE [Geminicoccaceae bacterium]
MQAAPGAAAATIVAPASAAGRAGVGVLRLSGSQGGELCARLSGGPPPAPRRAVLRTMVDPTTGEPIDRAMLLWFAGPHSYTGEDLLEIHHHGGPAVLAALLGACCGMPGVRPAEPGEFTRRAFLNGKLDLAQAEAIADLVDAATRAQARQALRQLDGELGRRAESWREAILEGLARLEAEIDFAAEEEVPEVQLGFVSAELQATAAAVGAALAEAGCGARLRTGVTVAVIGPPNAGKSTLVNLLARREVAIVTPHPGTTRDVLEVPLDLAGLPVTLLDTAGLREALDEIEAEGVARARRRAATADLRLVMLDAERSPERQLAELQPAEGDLVALNKIDLMPRGAAAEMKMGGLLPVSCRTGEGVERLLEALVERARALTGDGSAAVVTRERHRAALAEARDALERFQAGIGGAELALLAEELRLAARAIGRITGRTGVEEVLDRIFATFCIGK